LKCFHSPQLPEKQIAPFTQNPLVICVSNQNAKKRKTVVNPEKVGRQQSISFLA
jgi:hypothetical protein